jgi:hypothetical protein
VHRVEPALSLEWPAPFLIGLDQCHENVELIALWRPTGRAPKLLDLRECGTMVFVGADRADLHGGPSKSGNGQSIDSIVFGMRPDKLDEHDLPAEVE